MIGRLATAAVTVVALAGCGPATNGPSTGATPGEPAVVTTPPEQASPTSDERSVRLAFDSPSDLAVTPTGGAVAEPRVAGGAVIEATPGADGTDALRFPSYAPDKDGPRAVVIVSEVGGSGVLSPGASDFEFGADVKLDEHSDGTGADNGDNVVQRGLFADSAQYKLQVDHRRPSCGVRGSEGTLFVRASEIDPDSWYRVRCSRESDSLTIRVQRRTDGGWELIDEVSEEGALGSVDYSDPDIPLGIGGKVAASGELVLSQSDQFNGAIDNVDVAIEPAS